METSTNNRIARAGVCGVQKRFCGVQIGWQVVVLMYMLWRVLGFRFFFASLRF